MFLLNRDQVTYLTCDVLEAVEKAIYGYVNYINAKCNIQLHIKEYEPSIRMEVCYYPKKDSKDNMLVNKFIFNWEANLNVSAHGHTIIDTVCHSDSYSAASSSFDEPIKFNQLINIYKDGRAEDEYPFPLLEKFIKHIVYKLDDKLDDLASASGEDNFYGVVDRVGNMMQFFEATDQYMRNTFGLTDTLINQSLGYNLKLWGIVSKAWRHDIRTNFKSSWTEQLLEKILPYKHLFTGWWKSITDEWRSSLYDELSFHSPTSYVLNLDYLKKVLDMAEIGDAFRIYETLDGVIITWSDPIGMELFAYFANKDGQLVSTSDDPKLAKHHELIRHLTT